jgi:hypothetical protein
MRASNVTCRWRELEGSERRDSGANEGEGLCLFVNYFFAIRLRSVHCGCVYSLHLILPHLGWRTRSRPGVLCV